MREILVKLNYIQLAACFSSLGLLIVAIFNYCNLENKAKTVDRFV